MSIVGLTDEIVPRLPRLGKLRKGGEKTAKGFGEDLTHFRFTSEKPAIVEAFAAALGPQPNRLRVYLPYQSVDQAFPTWCELWDKTGLVHRCNGETMTIWRNGPKYERGSKPCTGGHEKGDFRNDAVGRLDLLIPELIEAGHVGYVTMETHSLHDILNITRVLAGVYEAHRDLRGIEFFLSRVKENISTPGWGDKADGRTRVDKWLVRLEPTAQWMSMQIARSHAAAMSLPSPEVIDGETGEIVPRAQLPAPAAEASAEEEKFFGKQPTATAPTTTSTFKLPAKPKGIGADMWKSIEAVAKEAIALGLTPTAIPPAIKAKELAEWGTTVKAAIAKAKKPASTNGKEITRADLLKRLNGLRAIADTLGVTYKTLEGNVSFDQLIDLGKKLHADLVSTARTMLEDEEAPDTDATIDAAVKALQAQKKEKAHA